MQEVAQNSHNFLIVAPKFLKVVQNVVFVPKGRSTSRDEIFGFSHKIFVHRYSFGYQENS